MNELVNIEVVSNLSSHQPKTDGCNFWDLPPTMAWGQNLAPNQLTVINRGGNTPHPHRAMY